MAKALDMVVQPVIAEMLPGGQGYRVRFGEPWTHFPTDDAVADTAAMNQWIEVGDPHNPAQYLWVHKRFKTRPAGEPSLYLKRRADNRGMRLPFTKMQGAGNDFVVLDATAPARPDGEARCARWATAFRRGRRPDPGRRTHRHAGRRLPLPHLQRRQRRGSGAVRQRRALLRALRASTRA